MERTNGETGAGAPKAQTRFNFYNPEEVHNATIAEKSSQSSFMNKEPATPASNRFNFYNAEEIHKTAPLHLPKPIDLTSLGATRNDCDHADNSDPIIEPSDDTNTLNILRSLQESEREQLMIKNGVNTKAAPRRLAARQQSNPYEAAIHDALAMLRSNRLRQQPPQSVWKDVRPKSDRILESRETSFSKLREKAEHRGREEFLDIHPCEIEVGTLSPSTEFHLNQQESSGPGQQGLSPPEQSPLEKSLLGRVDNTDLDLSSRVDPTGSLAEGSHESLEEEVHRGVERVLMAILDRAQSRDDLSRDRMDSSDDLTKAVSTLLNPSSPRDTDTPRVNPPSRRLAEENLTDDEGDVDDDSNDEINLSLESSNKRSVAEELLAEGIDRSIGVVPKSMELPNSPHTIFSKLSVEQGVDDVDEDDDINSRSDFATMVLEEEHMMIQTNARTQVLGPLSGRNTTGVVLEDSEPVVDDLDESDGEVEAVTSQVSTILESLSSVVKDAENFMSYMAGAVSPTNSCTKPDKYLPQDRAYSPQNRDAEPADSAVDTEANELMRSLCAHLLPYGVDKSTKHLSEIHPWDDLNPNEPGYRIIRLSKSQLRRVEAEFERMVNLVKLNSERYLGNKGANKSSCDGAGASYDENFEKDLQEAENLLDREEMLLAAVEKEQLLSEEYEDYEGSRHSVSTSEADESLLSCHPDFPGVRRSGKGEMGDLEYFNLPIIYKSHVTGFEPTKDLYLEPGNVVAGQYLVENELGSAAFSTAYRCIDLNSDVSGDGEFHEELCLKVIKNTKDFFDQSLDEIKILELLRQTGKCHENNILEMKCFFYHREHLIIVTELLRQNLFEFGKFIIDNNEEPYFTRRRLCYVTRQVLVALKFVHSLGLVHSDVKPENILLSSYSRGKVKLIDFGSSCFLTDRQSSYIQSRSYRAPEVVLGLPYDGKIDVWSLGCVVAEMYTGEVTFQNDSIVSMLSRIEAICGPFPRHMIAQGRQSSRFFTKSGLLYELVEPDDTRVNPVQDDDESGLFDVFQPKRTNWASRLGLDPAVIQRPMTADEYEQAMFVDFCQSLLTIDPDSRPTAAQALQHPWIVAGESLTEADIKYPSS